jgi:transposase
MRIRAIYAADEAFRKLAPAKRKLTRGEQLRPLLVDFFEWVKQTRSTSEERNLATKALGYAVNQEKELMRVLDDGRLPLDNTRRSVRCERSSSVGRIE